MKPRNCGIFEETTGKCLHCGMKTEGPQCDAPLLWSRRDYLLHAGRLLYNEAISLNPEGAVVLLGSGEQFNPLTNVVHVYHLLHALIRDYSWSLAYVVSDGTFSLRARNETAEYLIEANGQKALYGTRVSATSLNRATVIAAARQYLINTRSVWPDNLQSLQLPT
jgi:hypothetical protein